MVYCGSDLNSALIDFAKETREGLPFSWLYVQFHAIYGFPIVTGNRNRGQ